MRSIGSCCFSIAVYPPLSFRRDSDRHSARFRRVYHDLQNGTTEISIADQGMGMSEATRQKLFRLDTKIQRKGTNNESGAGLGLILCHELISRQGGSIDVTSKEGEGTVFKITIQKSNEKEDIQASHSGS